MPDWLEVPGLAVTVIDNAVNERREIYYSGRVQGVGFRYTTRSIASRHAVSGFVQNQGDGRVLLVVEGTPDVLDRLMAAIAAEMGRHIEHIDAKVQSATGEFSTFEVRH